MRRCCGRRPPRRQEPHHDQARTSVECVHVACEVCLKEVPKSEAVIPEAADYVAYFCGLECYQQWRGLAGESAAQPETASPPDELKP
jgi:hypothetical protein